MNMNTENDFSIGQTGTYVYNYPRRDSLLLSQGGRCGIMPLIKGAGLHQVGSAVSKAILFQMAL
jgi:hypothetical protein